MTHLTSSVLLSGFPQFELNWKTRLSHKRRAVLNLCFEPLSYTQRKENVSGQPWQPPLFWLFSRPLLMCSVTLLHRTRATLKCHHRKTTQETIHNQDFDKKSSLHEVVFCLFVLASCCIGLIAGYLLAFVGVQEHSYLIYQAALNPHTTFGWDGASVSHCVMSHFISIYSCCS